MKAFDRIAARIDEALIEERIRALPVERQRALVERVAKATGAFADAALPWPS